MRSAPDDRTAIARIRDAAIDQWGQHGFNVGLRSIAEAAGVSAALVIHHFGSKDGLRKACDDYIAEEIRSSKSESMQTTDPADLVRADGRDRVLRADDGLPGAQHAVRQRTGKDAVAQDDRQRRAVPGGRRARRHPQAEPRSRRPGPSTWASPAAAGSCSTCKCTTTQPICAPFFATTARRWCCPPSRSTPRA